MRFQEGAQPTLPTADRRLLYLVAGNQISDFPDASGHANSGGAKPAGFEPASSRFWRPRATTSALRLRLAGILASLASRKTCGRYSVMIPPRIPYLLMPYGVVYEAVPLRPRWVGGSAETRFWPALNPREPL